MPLTSLPQTSSLEETTPTSSEETTAPAAAVPTYRVCRIDECTGAAMKRENLCSTHVGERFKRWAADTAFRTDDYTPKRARLRDEEAETGTRHCGRCETFKDPSEFGKDKRAVDGLTNWCKKCRTEHEVARQRKRRHEAKQAKLAAEAAAQLDALITEGLAAADRDAAASAA